jgi:hypothetical protein
MKKFNNLEQNFIKKFSLYILISWFIQYESGRYLLKSDYFFILLPPTLSLILTLFCGPLYYLFYGREIRGGRKKSIYVCGYLLLTIVSLFISVRIVVHGGELSTMLSWHFWNSSYEKLSANFVMQLLANSTFKNALFLVYIGTLNVIFLGIFPISLAEKMKPTSFEFIKFIFRACLMTFKCWSRSIPLAQNIILEKINIVIGGCITNISSILFILYFHHLNFQGFYFLKVSYISWLASMVVILSPFFIGLFIDLDKTIENTYKRKLRRITDNLEGHVVILGFGEFGKKAFKEIQRIQQAKYDNLMIPNSNLELVDVRKNLLVVDKNEKLFQFPQLKSSDIKMGVVKDDDSEMGPYSPAIIGDVHLTSTLDNINMDQADFIMHAVVDETSTFELRKYQTEHVGNKKTPKFVYSFYRTSDKSFLVASGLDPNTFFIYPPQVSGIAIGNILYSFYRKKIGSSTIEDYTRDYIQQKKSEHKFENKRKDVRFEPSKNKPLQTLIVGDRKQIFFVLESLWLGLKNHFEGNCCSSTNKFIKDNLRMFADSEYLKEHLTYEKDMFQFPIPRSIRRVFNPVEKEEDVESYLKIPAAKGSSTNLIHLEDEINNHPPKYIISCFENGKSTLNFFHELLVIAERKNCWSATRTPGLA